MYNVFKLKRSTETGSSSQGGASFRMLDETQKLLSNVLNHANDKTLLSNVQTEFDGSRRAYGCLGVTMQLFIGIVYRLSNEILQLRQETFKLQEDLREQEKMELEVDKKFRELDSARGRLRDRRLFRHQEILYKSRNLRLEQTRTFATPQATVVDELKISDSSELPASQRIVSRRSRRAQSREQGRVRCFKKPRDEHGLFWESLPFREWTVDEVKEWINGSHVQWPKKMIPLLEEHFCTRSGQELLDCSEDDIFKLLNSKLFRSKWYANLRALDKLQAESKQREADMLLTSSYEPVFVDKMKHRAVVGIPNLMNTCYMSSALQCLVHIKSLTRYFHKIDLTQPEVLNESSDWKSREIASAWCEFVKTYFSNSPVDASRIKRAVGMLDERSMSTNDQQDSIDFIRALFEGLHSALNEGSGEVPNMETSRLSLDLSEETKRSFIEQKFKEAELECARTNTSIITKLFCGLYLIKECCGNCETTYFHFERFKVLSFALTKYLNELRDHESLKYLLFRCALPELRTMEQYYFHCFNCKSRQNCYYSKSVYKFPPVLVIQIQRWRSENSNEVLDTPVLMYDNETFGDKRTRYALQSGVFHSGTMDAGHYIAKVKSVKDRKWYQCNDRSVDRIQKSRDDFSLCSACVFHHESY